MKRVWEMPDEKVFAGTFVELQPLQPARDAPLFFEALCADERCDAIWKYLPYGPFASTQELQSWMESRAACAEERTFVVWRRNPSHPEYSAPIGAEPVGMTSLIAIVPEHGRAEIGHVWFLPKVQRSKVNTETQFLLLRHLFEEKNYRRAEWKCDAGNAASRAAAHRLGFTFEGRFRQHLLTKDGKNRDTDWFSMLDKEWPRCRANFQRFLYEENAPSLTELNWERAD